MNDDGKWAFRLQEGARSWRQHLPSPLASRMIVKLYATTGIQ